MSMFRCQPSEFETATFAEDRLPQRDLRNVIEIDRQHRFIVSKRREFEFAERRWALVPASQGTRLHKISLW
jgi:hypothetical protein